MAETSTRPGGRRWRRRAAIAAAVVAGYAALGFLAAPPLLRRTLVTRGSAALGRDVSIAKVRVNPFALSVTVEGLAVAHRGGAPFVAWDSLYVRLAPLRLVRGEVGLAEIRLVRPAFHVALAADGTLAFQDLLAPAPAAAPPGPAASDASGDDDDVTISIGRLSVEEARLSFLDETRRPAFATTLGPLSIRLESFRTKGGADSPYSFAATTDSGETLRWTGTVRVNPLRSAGTLAFDRIVLPKYGPYLSDDVLPADLKDGVLDLETRYELEWGAERRVLRASGGKLLVERLAVSPRGVEDPPVDLPRVEANGIEVDAVARTARVTEVTVRGGTLRARREADGTIELAKMMPPPSPEPPASEPWAWAVDRLAIAEVTLRFEDLSTPRPVTLPLTGLEVTLAPLRGTPDAVSNLSASASWPGHGRVALGGTVKPLGSAGTLDVEATDLELAPVAPYLEPDVAARLAAGRAGAKARVTFDASAEEPRWTFAGDVRLDGLAVTEQGNEELLRWRALEVSGVQADSSSRRASVRLVRLVSPRAKLYVWEDGTTSLARALRATGAAGGEPPPPATPAWRTSIGAVRVEGGRAAFVDRSVTPPAVVNLTRAEAKVTRLSTDPAVRSSVDVTLEVEGTPIHVTGALDALRNDAYTDLTIASAGVDLTPLGPYGGKFLGYGIRKGKLELDLRYKVVDRNLAGANVIRVNQFTLGEKTDSPDATKLPVRLALALLQDKDGVILLDVPVEGNLDDPEFRLGRVIWRAVLNVLGKIATSPFRALAALVGGGEADLSMAEFEPGTATPASSAEERFRLLAKSLQERPALGLDLEGAADPELDGTALRRAALERSLRRAKAAALRPVPAVEEVSLAPDERVRLVRTSYEAAFPRPPPKPGEAVLPAPTPQEMEDRLVTAAELPPDALRALASERAQRARDALVAAGLDPARIFLSEGGASANEEAPRVYFSVR
jgi:hypothetical protein